MFKISTTAFAAVLTAVSASLMAGCATSQPMTIMSNGPANPDAEEAPPAPTSSSLQSYKNFTRPAQDNRAPEKMGDMKDMDDMKDMGDMKGMEHGSMKGMNHDAMKNMPKGMPGRDDSAQEGMQKDPAEATHEH